MAKKFLESQYQELFKVLHNRGLERLGLMSNQSWKDDPRRILFVLSRYKFVSKMLSGSNNVLELGCGDGFASRIVCQEVKNLILTDFDPIFVEEAAALNPKLRVVKHDMTESVFSKKVDAIYCMDLIEHISKKKENIFMKNIVSSLNANGVFIAGSPSIESQRYASTQSKKGHVNCKSGEEFKVFLKKYFSNVFLFGMNDEVAHTGFYPMSHYLITLCCNGK